MELGIGFAEPVFRPETAQALCPEELDCFYAGASEVDRLNLFFMLLASLHHYEDEENRVLAAHLSFLTAYYLFTPLTPPGSLELALHYIRKAVRLHPLPKYTEWLTLMEQGN